MRIPRASFYLRVLAVVAASCFVGAVGASPVPQAAAGALQNTPPATRAPHARKVKRQLKPDQPGDQLLIASNPGPSFFPKQLAGTSSAPQAILITNSSTTVTVHVTSLTFQPATNPGFTETDNCVTALAPGGTCTVNLSFAPTAANVCILTPTLTLNDDDPGGSLIISPFGEASATGGLVTEDLTGGTLTPAALAQSLVGSGVTISNVTYTGAPIAAGTFTNGANIIGFDKGVILSDGAVPNVVGPNCDTEISQDNGEPGDQDLTNLICTDPTSCSDPTTTNDAAILEFDFVPTSSLLTFQYVFASDEYPEFVFDFNDVFAFFLNQTGTPKKDIALIPGTNTIVSINNVNDGNDGSVTPSLAAIPAVNPQFFVNNNLQFPTVSPLNTEMDGLTTVLAVQAPVVPGQTYHIKLAIADALDDALDSNVFIKGGSLSSTNLALAPPALGFGNENVDGKSAAQSVTITNVGATPLTGVVIGVTGPFAQTNNCPGTLAPGASSSCVINVTFDPTTAGPANGSVTITDSAPDSPQEITLGGTAFAGPFVTFSPTSLTFGPGTPGTVSAPQAITVTNTGAAALTINSIGSTDDGFAETDDCVDAAPIQPKGTCTINVTYDPAQAGVPESGLLTLADNAQNNGTQSVALTGNVTAGLTILPTSLTFGNQAVNTTSAPQTVTITNTGSANVIIPSVVVGNGFTETNNCTAAAGLAPTASCTAMVAFTPATATAFSTNLTLTDNGPNSPQVVALSGTGTAANNVALTITEAGTGTGTVTSAPAGINCQPTCSANFATGTQVILTATPAEGSTFTGWSGANSCEGTGTCTFTITAATSVTATFGGGTTNFALTVNEAGTGTGTVTSTPAGINCKPTCSANFASGTQVILTATPADGLTFTGWSGNSCEGTGTCTFTITAATSVTATFGGGTTNFALTVNEAGTGTGTVTSAPAGINCKPTCSANFASGTQVILTATAAEGSTFTGWSAPCEGTGTCAVTLTAATTVTATFNGPTGVIVTVPSGGSTTGTTTPGGTTFFGLIITCGAGQTGTVMLTATSSSNLITVNLIPNTVVCPGGAQQAVQLQTFCKGSTATTGSLPAGFGGGGMAMAVAMLLGGFGFAFRRDRRAAIAFAMVVIMVAMGIGACASLPKSPTGQATPPGTYFISLTTTLNGNVQTLPNFLTLVVK